MIHMTKIRGAIVGAFTADALGATLEFKTEADAKKMLLHYNNFNSGLVGGGPFNLNPGQFTDDSEMILANMSVIITCGYYDQEKVANAYHLWFSSHPYDIGQATRSAVSEPTAQKMIKIAQTINRTSLSNGCLMRLPGLVALYSNLNKSSKELIKAIIQDVSLTHSDPEIYNAAIIYGLILRKAIQGISASDLYSWTKSHSKKGSLISNIIYALDSDQDEFELNGKIFDSKQLDQKFCGFIGFALWLLFKCLLIHHSYKDAILYIVGLGGDTDTNACIVGAVFGALYPKTIPNKWLNSVYNYSDPVRFKNYPIANPAIWKTWLP